MNIEDFTKNISDQFLDEEKSKLTEDVEFRTLSSWDSLTGMAILTIIEDEYKVKIPVDNFRQIKTIRELYNFVKEN